MAKTRVQKEQIVSSLTDKLSQAKSVVFTNYQGMTSLQLLDLRSKLREQGAEFTITKNTLLKLALQSSAVSHQLLDKKESESRRLMTDDLLQGPTATLFAYEDDITPIKTLVKATKEYQTGKIKSGFLGEDFLDSFSLIKLAGLPSKQELRACAVGTLAAPLQGMVGVLQANLRNLVYALDQIRVTKGGG